MLYECPSMDQLGNSPASSLVNWSSLTLIHCIFGLLDNLKILRSLNIETSKTPLNKLLDKSISVSDKLDDKLISVSWFPQRLMTFNEDMPSIFI